MATPPVTIDAMTRAFISGCLTLLLCAVPIAGQPQQARQPEGSDSPQSRQPTAEVKEQPATSLAMRAAEAFGQPLHPVFKGAGGYSEPEARRFITRLREKIDEGLQLRARA